MDRTRTPFDDDDDVRALFVRAVMCSAATKRPSRGRRGKRRKKKRTCYDDDAIGPRGHPFAHVPKNSPDRNLLTAILGNARHDGRITRTITTDVTPFILCFARQTLLTGVHRHHYLRNRKHTFSIFIHAPHSLYKKFSAFFFLYKQSVFFFFYTIYTTSGDYPTLQLSLRL